MKSSVSAKLLCILSAAIVGVSTLLPYVSVPVFGATVSVKLIDSWEGYLVAGIAVLALLFALLGRYIFSLAGGFASLAVFLVENYNLPSGLDTAARVLSGIEEIGFCRLTSRDVVRHPLVQKIVEAYDKFEKKESHREDRKQRYLHRRKRNDD